MQANTTEITHNFEKEVVIDHCSTIGCALYELQYNAPLEQMLSLIELSAVCVQDFSFNCFLAPLLDDGVNHAWWVDKNGKSCTIFTEANYEKCGIFLGDRQYYFSGDNSALHTCQCGIDGTCNPVDGQNLACNCDAKRPTWDHDYGTIRSMSNLPITAFAYGPLEFDIEQGNFSIGRLSCSGEILIASM